MTWIPGPASERRDAIISVRTTPAERLVLEMVARSLGETLSNFMREASLTVAAGFVQEEEQS